MEEPQTKPHFMGAVVLQQIRVATATIERRIVVDGQQRLTTLQLLIDAIQEVVEDQSHDMPAKRLLNLVANGDAYLDGDEDHAFKVWPTTVDREAFRHAMSNDLPATDYAASRIVQAHSYFRDQTELWLARFDKNTDERDRAALALESAVSQSLVLVVIDLGETDNAHVIFETLNARGTPLLQSDMVKNKVLHDLGIGIRDDEDEASKKEKRIWPFDQDDWWAQEVGRGLQRRPRVDVYLNHWLTLRNRAEMKPYDEFRAFEKYSAEAEKETTDIVRDLRHIGNIYREVEEIKRLDIRKFLERRNVMNVGVVTPLLLWLLSADLQPRRLENCLTAIESFLARRMVCRLSARSYGEFFVGLIHKLANASPDQVDSTMVDYLKKQDAQATVWPSDDTLHRQMVTEPLYKYLPRGRLRMVLEAIEEVLRTNKAETAEATGKLHIEHIMPQTWEPHWPLAEAEIEDEDAVAERYRERDRMIHTIGNLTLVNGPLNSSLSNAPWKRKRRALRDHSVLFLNKRLVTKGPNVWDEAAIEKRSKWMHKQAAKVWPHASEFSFN